MGIRQGTAVCQHICVGFVPCGIPLVHPNDHVIVIIMIIYVALNSVLSAGSTVAAKLVHISLIARVIQVPIKVPTGYLYDSYTCR